MELEVDISESLKVNVSAEQIIQAFKEIHGDSSVLQLVNAMAEIVRELGEEEISSLTTAQTDLIVSFLQGQIEVFSNSKKT